VASFVLVRSRLRPVRLLVPHAGSLIALAALSFTILTGALVKRAAGSPGCDAVNAKGFDEVGGAFDRTVPGFAAGDSVALRLYCSTEAYCGFSFILAVTTRDGSEVSVRRELRDYVVHYLFTVPAAGEDITLTLKIYSPWMVIRVIGSCVAAPAK
jgi:hypothetical protein